MHFTREVERNQIWPGQHIMLQDYFGRTKPNKVFVRTKLQIAPENRIVDGVPELKRLALNTFKYCWGEPSLRSVFRRCSAVIVSLYRRAIQRFGNKKVLKAYGDSP